VVLAPGYSSLEYDAPKPGSYSLPPLGAAVDAQYIDSSGTRGRLHELFANHVTILSFIYTQCDDINGCPLATYVMSQVAKRLRNDPRIGEKLRMVSFSFDLERDTPQALAKYASSFRPAGAEWDFVVAPNRAALSETLAHYQQSVQQSGGHAFAHILRVFLVDSDARIRNIYSTSFLHGETLAADVETVLLEQGDIATPPADTRTPGYETATSVPPTAHHDPGLGLPPLPSAAGPPAGNAAVALGERLFFDRRLSLNRTISCAMCHVPAQGFTVNQLATAVGIEGRTVKRNAPTLLNVGFLDSFFHDARENRLEHQVWAPLLARNEMGNPSIGYVIEHLKQWPDYVDQFRTALDSDITMESVGAALAAYQRSLVAGASAFDRFFYAGETTALGPAAQRGFELFRGKANCASCHSIGTRSALFTDQALHNTGLGYLASMASGNSLRRAEVAPGTTIDYDLAYVAPSAERKPNDLGRYEVTEDPDDRWKFRTPSLRNVQLTAPYMHDGSLSSLADVIAFYNDGGVPNDLLDPLIRPLGLSANEQVDLLAFLRSLTSPVVASLIERAERTEVSNPAAGN
jgi:cytochrome c peroxidase